MRISRIGRMVVSIMVALAVAACAGVQQKPMVLEAGEKTLAIKVESYKFEPNDIKAHRGDVLTLKLENAAGIEHNLTINTPQGATLARVNIPPNGTVSVKVSLAEAGIYPFYCDKPLHSTLGMKGQIEAIAP